MTLAEDDGWIAAPLEISGPKELVTQLLNFPWHELNMELDGSTLVWERSERDGPEAATVTFSMAYLDVGIRNAA